MKKAIFIDFDGTLMDSTKGIIPKKSIESVKKLQENGHLVVIATGRNLRLLEDYPKLLGIDHVVGSNGRFVSIKNETVFEEPVPQDILLRLLEDLNRLGMDYTLSTDRKYFSHQKRTTLIDEFSDHFKMPKATIENDFDDFNHIFQINIFSEMKIPDMIINRYPLVFTQASKHAYDVTHGSALKETGLKVIKEKYGFEIEDIIAIGDGLNDIGMIKYAGIGIAMGNAKEPLKNVADYVTESIEKDGLSEAFKAFGLI